MRFLIKLACVLASSCSHPMIVQREDGWYCTECGAKVA